jgi:hypothetical protein
MKTILFSELAFGACASLAFSEPLPGAGSASGSTATGADPAGPVALTEAEMDQVTAGGGLAIREGSYFVSGVTHTYAGGGASPFDLIWDLDGGTTSQ